MHSFSLFFICNWGSLKEDDFLDNPCTYSVDWNTLTLVVYCLNWTIHDRQDIFFQILLWLRLVYTSLKWMLSSSSPSLFTIFHWWFCLISVLIRFFTFSLLPASSRALHHSHLFLENWFIFFPFLYIASKKWVYLCSL